MTPYAYLAILLTWMASITSVGYWQRGEGATAERLIWQEAYNRQLAEDNRVIDELHKKAREQEANHAIVFNKLSAHYLKESQDAEEKTKSLINRVRAGELRLRDASATVQTGSDRSGEACPGTSGGDGRTGSELSGTATEFLLGLTFEADTVVRQLKACQEVVKEDRKQCRR